MPQTGKPCQVSPVSGSGMNPSRLTTKMNRKSVATYGNQRPIAFVRQSLLGDLRLRDLVDLLAEASAACPARRSRASA